MIAYYTVAHRGKTHRWEEESPGHWRSRCGLAVENRALGTVQFPPREPGCIKCRYGVNPKARHAQDSRK